MATSIESSTRPTMRRWLLAGVVVAGVAFAGFRFFADAFHRPVATHSPLASYSTTGYARVLEAAVHGDGYVDYRLIRHEWIAELDQFVEAVGRVGPHSTPEAFPTREDQLAYYLNTHNALVMRLVLDRSINEMPREMSRWGLSSTEWLVDGQWMTIDHLAQRVIVPTFGEPRVRYALSCGAADAPPLRQEPFEPGRLDAQLEDQGRRFFTLPGTVRVEGAGTIHLNDLFRRHRGDLVRDGSLLATVLHYLPLDHPLRAALSSAGETAIRFQPFDWTLNDISHRPLQRPTPGDEP